MKRSALFALALMFTASSAHAHQFVSYFEYGQAELSAGGYRMAREASAYIKRDRPERVRIDAHIDSAEATEFSDELSRRRAQALATELVNQGVNPAHLELNGRGASSPAKPLPENTREPLNRRVTLDY